MTTAPQAQHTPGQRRHIHEMLRLYDQCAGDWCVIARHIEAETIETAAERDRLRAEVAQWKSIHADHVARMDAAMAANSSDATNARIETDRLRARNVALVMALELAVRQNSHDMLMTGDELRLCQSALRATGA